MTEPLRPLIDVTELDPDAARATFIGDVKLVGHGDFRDTIMRNAVIQIGPFGDDHTSIVDTGVDDE